MGGQVSDPDHIRYGQHLSFDEVNDLVKPADKTLDSVHEWLSDNGVSVHEYSPAKDVSIAGVHNLPSRISRSNFPSTQLLNLSLPSGSMCTLTLNPPSGC